MPLILPDIKTIERLQRNKRQKKGKPVKSSPKTERQLLLDLNNLWKKVLLPASERLQKLLNEGASASRIADEIDMMVRQATDIYELMSPAILDRWLMSLDQQTRYKLNDSLRASLGVDTSVIFDDPKVADALSMGSMEAAALIKTIPSEFFGKIAKAVSNNFTGQPLPENRSLIQQIQHLSGVSYRRAKLIARDQTAKVTATVNQTRQQAIGIDTYIWHTSRDSRVVGNPSGVSPIGNDMHGDHYHMEGKYCRWDDPTVYSDDGEVWKKRESRMPKNAPGQDIQCRCFATPVIDVAKIASLARQE